MDESSGKNDTPGVGQMETHKNNGIAISSVNGSTKQIERQQS
jgi:hypothetical protein